MRMRMPPATIRLCLLVTAWWLAVLWGAGLEGEALLLAGLGLPLLIVASVCSVRRLTGRTGRVLS